MKTPTALDEALRENFPLSAEELVEALPRYRSAGANQDFLSERERLEGADDETLNASAASAGSLKVGDVVAMLARSYWAMMDLDDEIAEAGSVTERLNQASAKEESIRRLLEMQTRMVKEMAAREEKAGNLLSPSEMAKTLKISGRSLRDYSERGILPFVRLGRHRRYDKAEVLAAAKLAANDGRINLASIRSVLA